MYTVTNLSSSPSFLHPHYSLLRTTLASFSLYVNTRCLTQRETSISSISSPSHQRVQYSSEFAPFLAHTIFQTYSQMTTDSLLPCSHRSFLHEIAYAIQVLQRHSLEIPRIASQRCPLLQQVSVLPWRRWQELHVFFVARPTRLVVNPVGWEFRGPLLSYLPPERHPAA